MALGAAALIGLFQGFAGALVMVGITALVWTIVQTARRKRVLGAGGFSNAIVAAIAVAVVTLGAAIAPDATPQTPPTAAPTSSQPAPTSPAESDEGAAGDPDATTTDAGDPDATHADTGSTSTGSDATNGDTVDADAGSGGGETVGGDATGDSSGPDGSTSDDAEDGDTDEVTTPAATTALAVLATLPTKGRAPRTGYDRDSFAYREFDMDRNGCDARNDILRRDLRKVVIQKGTQGCVVLSGVLDDPYSGKKIDFTRGWDTSADIQIDHVVALSDAWQKGAQAWDDATKKAFGNDPLNLLAADGPLNQQKSDSDAASWLPPNKAFRCEYVARQIAVKAQYKLWVTKAERAAMEKVLGSCKNQPIPVDSTTPVDPDPAESATTTTAQNSQKKSTTTTTTTGGGDVYYQNCTAVRQAGADPIRRGQPGYASHLDRDGDGIGCE